MFCAPDNGHRGALSYLCRIMMWDGYSALRDRVNLPVISMTQKTMKGAEFLAEVKISSKVEAYYFLL